MTNDQWVDTKLDWKIKRQEHHYNKPLGWFIYVFIIVEVSNKDHQDYKEGLAVDTKYADLVTT